MKNHPNLVLMGQDIAEYGGAFKITEGFVENLAKKRVRNTPLLRSCDCRVLVWDSALMVTNLW